LTHEITFAKPVAGILWKLPVHV